MAFGVGVEARREATARELQVADHPVGRLGRDFREQRLAGRDRGLRIDREQRAVVVEHLLEVRDHPPGVDRIAAEAAAELVVETALGHARQRQRGHVERLQVGLGVAGGGVPVAQQPLEGRCRRKLRRAAEATEVAVEARLELAACLAQRQLVECQSAVGRRGRDGVEGLPQRRVLLADLGTALAVVLRDAAQDLAERRQAVACVLREISAAEKRHLVAGGQEHGQWPAAAALRQQLVRELVDAVEVGPLLAVHLHVDEQLVHQRRGRLVLEGLVRHDVAPVAGGVADREQDRLGGSARALERLRAPGMPVHGVRGVLQEIGAGLAREPVRH